MIELQVLFPSPRNTTWINNSLLEQTKCNTFFASAEMIPKAQSQQQERQQLKVLPVSSLDDMLAEVGGWKHYPFHRDFAAARWDPVVVLHSSGSTGTL